MSNNRYLYGVLAKAKRKVEPGWEPLVQVSYKNKKYRVYVPDPSEYLVTIDLVQKALGLGANIITYAQSWCEASKEAILYGKQNGVDVIPHAAFYRMLNLDEGNSD